MMWAAQVPAEELELLVVLDSDMIYDQNFYFCVTEEAAQAVIEQFAAAPGAGKGEAGGDGPAAEEEEPVEPRPREIVDPDPVNRPWVEFEAVVEEGKAAPPKTSDEIDALVIRDLEPKLKYGIIRKRNHFGQGAARFHDADHIEVEDFKPYRDPQFKENPDQPGVFGTRFMLSDTATQCVPHSQDGASQTARYRLVNSMVQYAPIMVDAKSGDAEEAQKEEDSLAEMLAEMAPLAEAALKTNETISVFVDDLSNLGDEETLGNTSDNKIKEYSSPFTDITYSKNKIISCIDWMPGAKGTVAVACTEKVSLDEQVDMDGKVRTSHILIWNFRDPIHPQFVLNAPGDIFCFKFNPENNDLLAAGCANGQVLYWNLKGAKNSAIQKDKNDKGGQAGDEDQGGKDDVKTIRAEMTSTIEVSHRRPVAALRWLPPNKEVAPRTGAIVPSEKKVSKQILTLAADGMLLFWDLEVTKADKNGALLWTPIHRIIMNSVEGSGELGGCQLQLHTAEEGEDATKFVVGTEDGELVYGIWQLPEEEGATHIQSSYAAHYGPVVALERSPFFQDIMLTVGDWTFNVFRGATTEPVLKSSYSNTYLTTGRFSPTRPGVIFTGRSDGGIEIWDLMDRSHEASLDHNVSPVAVTSMEFWYDATSSVQLLAVGDAQGTLHVLEIPRNLRRAFPNEEGLVLSLLDREVGRVEYMRERMTVRGKELSIKEAEDEQKKQAADEAAAQAAAAEIAAKEAAEAAAQALATGEGEVVEEVVEEDGENKKLNKADEAEEARYKKIEDDFKEKIGLA